MSTVSTILDVGDLCVCYGKVEALHHASIRVGEGQIITVIGPKGAGKTTMLSLIVTTHVGRNSIAIPGLRNGGASR